jgi:hypothetical protein
LADPARPAAKDCPAKRGHLLAGISVHSS